MCWEIKDGRAPVTSVAVRIKCDQADSWSIRAVFTHKTVGVRPMWRVFGHQGNGDCDLLYIVNGTLHLKWKTRQEHKRKKEAGRGKEVKHIVQPQMMTSSLTFCFSCDHKMFHWHYSIVILVTGILNITIQWGDDDFHLNCNTWN